MSNRKMIVGALVEVDDAPGRWVIESIVSRPGQYGMGSDGECHLFNIDTGFRMRVRHDLGRLCKGARLTGGVARPTGWEVKA